MWPDVELMMKFTWSLYVLYKLFLFGGLKRHQESPPFQKSSLKTPKSPAVVFIFFPILLNHFKSPHIIASTQTLFSMATMRLRAGL